MYQQLTIYLLMVLFVLGGCTSTRNFDSAKFQKLRAGETATIYHQNGRVQTLLIAEITDYEIRGQVEGTQTVTSIPLEEINSVDVVRTDYLKSGAAAVGATVVMAAGAILGFTMLLAAGG